MLKAIHAEESKKASREKAATVVAELKAMKLPEAAKKVADGIEETLTYCDFPSEHWVKIRTNNVIERMNREIRRRTRVVGAFPDGNSALMLVCARLRHVAGTQWGSKKYMNMKHLEAMEQELLDGAAAEAVTIDRDYEVTLDDGAPLPTAALPLYYKGNYAGLTWAELAEQTGFAEAELRALNPDAAQNPDGALAGTGELLLAESYPVPQEAQILVTFSAPGVPYPYSSRDFRVPAALEQEAAVALAKAYYETWAEGQGLAVQESNVDSYRTVTGGRFADFAAVQEYYSTIWAGEALEVLLEPYPWRGAAPTAYFAEGPDGELLTQGYAYDSVIPQAGYTHTAPQTAPDGSVTFAGICIQTTDDTGAPLPAEAGRLLYTPIRLEETEAGWRVTSVGAPF